MLRIIRGIPPMKNLLVFALSVSLFSNAMACGAGPARTYKLTTADQSEFLSMYSDDIIEIRLPGSIDDGWRSTIKPRGVASLLKITRDDKEGEKYTLLQFEGSRSNQEPFKISIRSSQSAKTYSYKLYVNPAIVSAHVGCGSEDGFKGSSSKALPKGSWGMDLPPGVRVEEIEIKN